MGGWRDEPKILTRGDGGMEGIPPRPGTAMVILNLELAEILVRMDLCHALGVFLLLRQEAIMNLDVLV